MTIEDIISRAEGQTFDCKSFSIEPKALAQTMVAMANADGGILAVGISDRKRMIEGVDVNEAHLNELLRTPFDFCVPTVNARFELVPCVNMRGEADHVLVFHIEQSAELHATQSDECFLRIGDKSRRLTFAERVQLMYDKGVQRYEDTIVHDATTDDLDMDAVADYMQVLGYGKTPREFLIENFGFLRIKDGREQVSVACILLFGKHPQRFFPRARVRFIKYAGTEEKVGREMNVVKDITYEGTLISQIRQMVQLLELMTDEHTFLGPNGIFITQRQYPQFVLQEMIVNAVCHRDYAISGTEIQVKLFANRLVCESPGTLPGNVRTHNIRHTHFSRNPHIAQYLKAYKYVKEFGEGVDRMCRELSELGIVEPLYHQEAFILKVTTMAANDNETITHEPINDGIETIKPNNETINEPLKLNGDPLKVIYELICRHPSVSAVELANISGKSYTTVKRYIKILLDMHLVRREGAKKIGGYLAI